MFFGFFYCELMYYLDMFWNIEMNKNKEMDLDNFKELLFMFLGLIFI